MKFSNIPAKPARTRLTKLAEVVNSLRRPNPDTGEMDAKPVLSSKSGAQQRCDKIAELGDKEFQVLDLRDFTVLSEAHPDDEELAEAVTVLSALYNSPENQARTYNGEPKPLDAVMIIRTQ